jgi:hypothetical protein
LAEEVNSAELVEEDYLVVGVNSAERNLGEHQKLEVKLEVKLVVKPVGEKNWDYKPLNIKAMAELLKSLGEVAIQIWLVVLIVVLLAGVLILCRDKKVKK